MSLFVARAGGVAHPPTPRIQHGSPQQEAFWSELIEGESHVVLQARAGTGKSSSCREGIWRLRESDPSLRCFYVAFNKSIADEFNAGLPPGASATTMHSAGYAAIRMSQPGAVAVEPRKMWSIADGFVEGRDAESRKAKSAAVKLAGACKALLLGLDAQSVRYGLPVGVLNSLAASYGVDLGLERERVAKLIPRILERCRAIPRVVDYSDMTWLPVVLGMSFPATDCLFIDEAQDLDPCQHALVRRIAADGRLIVVGDAYQAIYGFRGADTASIATLRRQLGSSDRGVREFPLTMTRRCPSSHVDLARAIVPDFASVPDSPPGRIESELDESEALVPGTMALSRVNAPLVAAAFRLAGSGVPVAIQGKDLGEGLARFVQGFEAESVRDLVRKVHAYQAAELVRLSESDDADSAIEQLADRCSCVLAVSSGADTPGQVVDRVRSLFLDPTPEHRARIVLLSSIHRAKGREANRVAILEPGSMPHPAARTDAARQQELNLIYVAATRSKDYLAFCGPIPDPLVPDGSQPADPDWARSKLAEQAILDSRGGDPHGPSDREPLSDLDRKRIAAFGLRVSNP